MINNNISAYSIDLVYDEIIIKCLHVYLNVRVYGCEISTTSIFKSRFI